MARTVGPKKSRVQLELDTRANGDTSTFDSGLISNTFLKVRSGVAYQKIIASGTSKGYFHLSFKLNKMNTLARPAFAQSSSSSVGDCFAFLVLLQNI